MYLNFITSMQNPNTLYLYQYNLSALPLTTPYQLTDYELTKCLRLPQTQQETYRLTRYIIRDVLNQHGISPQQLYYATTGKPLLNSTFSISLSHSESILLIAIMKTEKLGIDVQIPLPKNKQTLLARLNLPGTISDASLLQHWTLIESYCKCMQKPLLSTLSMPIKTLINNENLFMITRAQPFTFSAVSTSTIKKTRLIPQKSAFDG